MSRVIVLIALVFFPAVAITDFHDEGFYSAVIRTDYDSQTEGQSTNPLTFTSPCLFPGQLCGTSPTTYANTNSWKQNTSSWPSSNFWVLSINNENAYDKRCPINPDANIVDICDGHEGDVIVSTQNPGPPNQSLPRSSPGYGLMGFTAIKDSLPGEDFYRAHIVMNGTFTNPEFGGIPYLSVGADSNRGNGSTLGFMNLFWGPHNVKFNARLWDFKLPTPVSETQPATLAFYLVALSEWGGKKRGVFLTLAHWGLEHSSSTTADAVQLKWNWPVQESFYHDGAEFAYLDSEDIYSLCRYSVPRLTTIGQEISYNIDLEKIFSCADSLGGFEDPMPTGVLDIEAVHWAVEMTGEDGWLWPSVHGMRID